MKTELKDRILNMQFKNIDKIFQKGKISKMRTEDLIGMYATKKRFMLKDEKDIWNQKIFGTGCNQFPFGHELLMERKGGKLKLTSMEDY